jgi:heparin/heparan-sulfate lyase
MALPPDRAIAQTYPAVPDTHPRVFITPAEIPLLQSKKTEPEFQELWGRIVTLSNEHFLSAALVFMVKNEKKKGNWAVSQALIALQNKRSESVAINKSSNIMNRAACVYDWCYDLLDSETKNDFIAEFIRLANTEHPYYPANYNPYSVIVGHIAESNVQVSQLIAGCAIYGESPTMWNAVIALHWDKFIPARNELYKMHMYWQGDSYFSRFTNDSYNAWFYRKLGLGDVYISDMQYVPYGMIYNTRSDGRQFKRGDRYNLKGNAGKKGPICRSMAMYWENPYLATIGDDPWYAYYTSDDWERVFEFVFRPAGLTGAPFTDFPLTKYFPDPMGEMIARTGWDWLDEESSDAAFTMELGGCDFKGHTNPGHFGGFQIYYKGALAISTGVYQNKTAHDNNYHEKSQSHNVLLILDPNEDTTYGTDGAATANDGGQISQGHSYETKPEDVQDLLSRFRKAYVTGHQFGPDQNIPEYSYISGDLTPAYWSQPTPKASDVSRSMVMLNHFNDTYPATLIVFDRVVSTSTSFKKTWQIHSIEEPEISDSTITIRRTARHYSDGPSGGAGYYSGKLVVRSLLPADGMLQAIGGPGFDCWVDYEQTNYPPDPQGANYDYENGLWRAEVSPAGSREEDLFLHVMTVMDDAIPVGPLVEAIDTEQLAGAKLLDRAVCFSKDGSELSGQVGLTIPGLDTVKVLVCSLQPGTWTVAGNNIELTGLSATDDGKSIYFTVPGGDYTLTHSDAAAVNESESLPQIMLSQNYPNPFNATTMITFSLKHRFQVSLNIYDLRGRQVAILETGLLRPGNHQVVWDGNTADGREAPTGIYIARLVTPGYTQSIKMVLLR